MHRTCWQRISILLGTVAAVSCRPDNVGEQAFAVIVGRPAEHTSRPYCVPDGPRALSAGLRRPTWCTVHFAEGNAIWRRDASGTLLSAARMWALHDKDSLRWPHLRDSVTGELGALAGSGEACLSDQPVGNGERVSMWLLPGYRIGITRSERVPHGPGGYQLSIGVVRDSACLLSPGPPA
jgi:hypothetical protein